MQVAHGIPIPSHMALPMQDGYRTPTIEDYELHFSQDSLPERLNASPGLSSANSERDPGVAAATAAKESATAHGQGSSGGDLQDHERENNNDELRPRNVRISVPRFEVSSHDEEKTPEHDNQRHPDAPARTPKFRPISFSRSPLTLSTMSDILDEKLQWRQRLRHFTWNFFSLTMATGGIANVLFNGE